MPMKPTLQLVDLLRQDREALKKIHTHVRVLEMHTVKPLDVEAALQAARETGALVTAEEHSIVGGWAARWPRQWLNPAPCRSSGWACRIASPRAVPTTLFSTATGCRSSTSSTPRNRQLR